MFSQLACRTKPARCRSSGPVPSMIDPPKLSASIRRRYLSFTIQPTFSHDIVPVRGTAGAGTCCDVSVAKY